MGGGRAGDQRRGAGAMTDGFVSGFTPQEIASFLMFSPDERCLKCGAATPSMKHHVVKAGEYLGLTCFRCGYSWFRRPLDCKEVLPMSDASRPSVGRIVHFVSPDESFGVAAMEHCAAIITRVRADEAQYSTPRVDLTVFYPEDTGVVRGVPYNDGSSGLHLPRTWHWQERV